MYNIFHVEGGIGRNLVASSMINSINEKYPANKTIVVCSYPEVFIHNPKIYRVFRAGLTPYFHDDYVKDKNSVILKGDPYNTTGYINRKEHISKSWCDIFNLNTCDPLPELYFNKMEKRDSLLFKQNVSPEKPIILVQINGGMGYGKNHVNLHWYRDVPPYYYQKIIDIFSDKFTFVQIKTENQIQLENVYVPNLSLRELFAAFQAADGAICMDSMVQHAMAALKKQSLVCWIGNSPTVFGYEQHRNIISDFKFEKEVLESYLEPYSIQAEGYQCPDNYDPATLFNLEQLIEEFKKIYIKT